MLNRLKQFIKGRLLPESLLIQRLNDESTNSILLTFDDGPDPETTPKVLELLSRYDAKAIFFIPGRRIERAPELLAEIVEQGHLIGNHTFIHANGKQPGFFAYWRDIVKCQRMIKDNCGIVPRFFRPPCGVVSPTTLIVPKFVGLRTMTWSFDGQDWACKSKSGATETINKLLKEVKMGDIVLFHDDNHHIVSILEEVLPELKKMGINLEYGLNCLCK